MLKSTRVVFNDTPCIFVFLNVGVYIFLFLNSGKGSVLNSDNDTTKLFLKFHETPCRYVAIFEEWSIFQVQ
jgi:hypothetical protein